MELIERVLQWNPKDHPLYAKRFHPL